MNAVACRFEYVFDLSFCALAWRAAEEFEKDSDTSGDEGPPDQSGSHAISSACDGPKNGEKKTAVKGAEAEPSGEGKRRVQVTGKQQVSTTGVRPYSFLFSSLLLFQSHPPSSWIQGRRTSSASPFLLEGSWF